MMTEEKHLADGGDAMAADEPLFTEEAEEEARPVIPLRRVDDSAPAAGPLLGRFPQSLALVLAVIVAGAAGAGVGYLTFRERTPSPAVEATTAAAPDPATTPAAVSESTNTPAGEKSDAAAPTEQPTRVEPERAENNRAEVSGLAAENKAESESEARPRREAEAASAERRHEAGARRTVRSGGVRQAVPRTEEDGGRPKARLVGTITVRSRH